MTQRARRPRRPPWRYRRPLVIFTLGVVVFALGVAYMALPADRLWPMVPGHSSTSHLHPMPDAVGCFVVALAMLIWAALSMPKLPPERRPEVSRPRLVPRPDLTVPRDGPPYE
jgi:hypothetical protein